MTPARHGRRRPPRAGVLAAALALVVLTLGAGRTYSGWATGTLVNDAPSAQVAAVGVDHAYGSSSCSSTVRSSTATCTPGLGTTASPPASVSDSVSNTGSVAVTQSVNAASCAPVQLANAANASDPMLPRNGVAFQQADRWGTTSAVSLSGSGYATDVVGTNGSGVLGLLQSSYTIGVWFRSSDSQGGGLLSLSASASNGSGGANPALWLDSAGNVNGHVSTTVAGTDLHSSGVDYADGKWHYAALVVSTVALVGTSIVLYVDGGSVASSGGLALLTSTTGYWHLGWVNVSGLSNAPTSPYFHGSLSGAFVQRGALDGSTVSTLWKSASAAAYQATLAGQSPASTWMLADDGVATVPASTTLPSTMSDPCGKVLVTFTSDSGLSTVPASLASLVGTSSGLGSLGPGSTQVLSIKTTADAPDLAGVRLLVPLTFTYTVPGSTSWTQTFTFPAAATQVFWA